jgi:CDP-diacylglycerol--glycerol-3-phosphate 3-phosphatidyltransferase
MNLPNLLTLSRIFVVPVLIAALLTSRESLDLPGYSLPWKRLALVLFLLAALTDALDGFLARRWGQTSKLGTLLDPVADKLLVASTLIALVQRDAIPAWVAIVQIGRDIAVTGFRSIAAQHGCTIPASPWGKWKMAGQVLMLALLIGGLSWPALSQPGLAVAYVVTAVSVYGGLDYFLRFKSAVPI